MKKYLLFADENYYPKGGMRDFKGSFDTIEDAEIMFNDNESGMCGWGWYQIVERETLEVVKEDGSPYGSC